MDVNVGTHDDDADVILFEVERDALETVGKLDELRRPNASQSVDPGEVRTDFDDRSNFIFGDAGLELLDLRLEDSSYFVCVDHA